MKKILTISAVAVLVLILITGCGTSADKFDKGSSISVISREDGSGTRGAFIELFGIEVKKDDGTRKDMTTKEAIIADKTDIMMTNIASDPHAIGYISLGSLNDTVKALDIDGVKASAANVKNGTYKISRPFNIAVKGEASGLLKDFIDFIFSKEGQEVIAAKDCIAVDDGAPAYSGSKPGGKITVGGSSSVNPVMEKLKEAYEKINTNALIEIQISDSSTGMADTINGTFDIGMASRELKDSEKAELTSMAIAVDGIAVVVNSNNTLTNLTVDEVKGIFTGEIITWNEIIK